MLTATPPIRRTPTDCASAASSSRRASSTTLARVAGSGSVIRASSQRGRGRALRCLRELGERVAIELEAEPGAPGDVERAVAVDELVAGQLLAQARLAELGRQELEEGHVRRD